MLILLLFFLLFLIFFFVVAINESDKKYIFSLLRRMFSLANVVYVSFRGGLCGE